MKYRRAAETNPLLAKPKRYTSVVFVLVVVAGIMGSIFAGISMDLRNREYYRTQAITIAQNLPIQELKSLQGRPDDADTLAYEALKNRMIQARSIKPEIQFVYLMGLKEGEVFFYVDSESKISPYYSAPGSTYEEASIALVSAFNAFDQPFIEGPQRNRGGAWITALAAVKEPVTGKVLAIVGLDVPAYTYYSQLLIYALVPLLLAAIPIAGLLRDRKLEMKEHEILGLKSQFVSIASHELRSPLNGMLWAIQSLLKKTDSDKEPEQSEMLHDMYRSAESSLATVNEILDFSVFDRGKQHGLRKDIIDINKVIDEVLRTLKLGAAEKSIQIVRSEPWPDQAVTRSDVAALKRSFMNVISNAIKYSPKNSTITVKYVMENGLHVISIADQGIGIPKEEQAKVLQGYYRATNAKQIQAQGTGLGLWLSRLVAEEAGGKLWLESSGGKGTTIYLGLPSA